jgi:MFS superfamily sulfate permease-like transporter
MFANATVFRDLIREQLAASDPQPTWVIIAAEPITDLDTTAADMLRDLDLELNAKGSHLIFAEFQGPVRDHLVKLGLQQTIDARHFYPTIDAAIEDISRQSTTE